MTALALIAYAAALYLSIAHRRAAWSWFPWIGAVVASAAIVVLPTWLLAITLPLSGPGGGGEWIVLPIFAAGLIVGGGALFLLGRFRPTYSVRRLLWAACAWTIVLAMTGAVVAQWSRVTLHLAVRDEHGDAVAGATIKYRVVLMSFPFAVKTDGEAITDPTGKATIRCIAFAHAGMTVAKPELSRIVQSVNVYRWDGGGPGYRISFQPYIPEIHDRSQPVRDPVLDRPRGREVDVPVILRTR